MYIESACLAGLWRSYEWKDPGPMALLHFAAQHAEPTRSAKSEVLAPRRGCGHEEPKKVRITLNQALYGPSFGWGFVGPCK